MKTHAHMQELYINTLTNSERKVATSGIVCLSLWRRRHVRRKEPAFSSDFSQIFTFMVTNMMVGIIHEEGKKKRREQKENEKKPRRLGPKPIKKEYYSWTRQKSRLGSVCAMSDILSCYVYVIIMRN